MSFHGSRVSRGGDVRYCYEKNAYEGLHYGKDDGLRYRSTHPTGLPPTLGIFSWFQGVPKGREELSRKVSREVKIPPAPVVSG